MNHRVLLRRSTPSESPLASSVSLSPSPGAKPRSGQRAVITYATTEDTTTKDVVAQAI